MPKTIFQISELRTTQSGSSMIHLAIIDTSRDAKITLFGTNAEKSYTEGDIACITQVWCRSSNYGTSLSTLRGATVNVCTRINSINIINFQNLLDQNFAIYNWNYSQKKKWAQTQIKYSFKIIIK